LGAALTNIKKVKTEKRQKKEKAPVRKLSGKLHLWLGLSSGLVVFIVGLTGCLFVFEEEIRNYTQKEIRWVPPVANRQFISIEKIEQTIIAALPDKKIKQIRTYTNPKKAWQVHLDKDMAAAINPYNGKIIEIYNRKDWLHTVEEIHTSLLLGNVGKWIIRINVLIFLVLLITGLVLWWPANRARRKQSFKVKWDASAKRVNYDFHNVVGFYSAIFLLLIVFTGLYMSFDWMKQFTYFVTGSSYKKIPPAIVQPNKNNTVIFNPAVAYEKATTQNPGAQEIHINYPQKNNDPIKLKLHYASTGYKKVNEFHYNPFTGTIINAQLYKNYSNGDKIKHSNRDLHTGTYFGLIGKIIACLASLVAASMPVTGFAIWWVRNQKKKPVKVRPTVRALATT
jgi:uncharacterized iron-regulated membrane protein